MGGGGWVGGLVLEPLASERASVMVGGYGARTGAEGGGGRGLDL